MIKKFQGGITISSAKDTVAQRRNFISPQDRTRRTVVFLEKEEFLCFVNDERLRKQLRVISIKEEAYQQEFITLVKEKSIKTILCYS